MLLGNKTILAMDVNMPSDYDTYLNIGAEVNIFELISLRGGYKSEDDLANGLRLGGGVTGKNLRIDYAWMPRGDFDTSHRFSMSLRLGRKYDENKIQQNIREHFETGKKYFDSGRYLKAYRIFKDVLMVAPRHRGAQDFITRIELSVEDAEVSREIESELSRGKKLYADEDLTGARSAFELALALNPDCSEAKEYIKNIDDRFKKVVGAFMSRGIAYFDKADYDSAMKEMDRVLALDPENDEAQKYAGLIKEKQDELIRIKQELKRKQEARILKRKITNYLTHGKDYIKKKQWKDAAKYYKKVLAISPNNADAKQNMANLYYNLGVDKKQKNDMLEAMEYVNKALEFNPELEKAGKAKSDIRTKLNEQAEELNRKGLIEYSNGNLKNASECWEKAIKYNPDMASARENLKRVKKEIK
jgi:tetratricopeptide (TPR) repeat protein